MTNPAGTRVFPKALSGLLIMLAMTAVLFGCGQGPGGEPPSNDRGGAVSPPPDVDGTWIGSATFAESGNKFRLMLDLEQDGAALSGSANFAGEDDLYPLPTLEGEARASREISLSRVYGEDAGEARWTFEGEVRGADTISGETRAVDSEGEEDKGSFEARRLDPSDTADMGLATVQALYDRNYVWLADHGQYEWEQHLRELYGTPEEGDDADAFLGDEFATNIYAQFFDEGGDALPKGEGIEVDEESFVITENPPYYAVGFEYSRTDGEAGTALVSLVESGADSESANYQIMEVELDYPTDGGSEILFLGLDD